MNTLELVPQQLLADIKNHLDITWHDDATDRKLTELAASGVMYLNGKLGATGDYLVPGAPRTLLFEYVRYARDGAMDIFESNYLHLILEMQTERQLEAYETKKADPPRQ